MASKAEVIYSGAIAYIGNTRYSDGDVITNPDHIKKAKLAKVTKCTQAKEVKKDEPKQSVTKSTK